MYPRATRAMALGLMLSVAAAAAAAADGFKKAPPLKLPNLEGKTVEIKYADAGVTLVNFWATWCLPCREEMPAIDRLHEKHRAKGFRAAGIALQSGEAADVKAFFEKRKFAPSYPILLGDEELAASYGDIEIVPTTYLIGPSGEVLKTYFGVTGSFEQEIGAEIEKILAAAPPKKG